MKEITHKGHRIEIQDNVQELPIGRFIAFQRHLLAAADIGGTVQDVDLRLRRHTAYLLEKQYANAVVEAQNLRFALQNAIKGLSPSTLAFACLVEKINGVEVPGHDEAGLNWIIDKLKQKKYPWSKLQMALEAAKKKIHAELNAFRKKTAPLDPEAIMSRQLLAKRTKTIIDRIAAGKFTWADIEEVDRALMLVYDPKTYVGKESAEVEFINRMEAASTALGKFLGFDPSGFSTLRFFQSLELMQSSLKSSKA